MFHRTCMLVCSTQHIRCGVIAHSCLKGDSRAPLMRIWHLRHTFLISLIRIRDGANQFFGKNYGCVRSVYHDFHSGSS